MFSEVMMRRHSDNMDMSPAAVSVSGVGKCFRVYERPIHRLLQGVLGESRKLYREFWALRDISLNIRQGETVGIVGRNGSGKSTLLQIIAGTLAPTTGTVQTRGRIAALLELGSGFNLDFTGIENIYLNGALLGLSRAEMDACMDDILAFADIGNFVRQPVKTYSSGMVVRLAFAVQAQVNPQVLIVDEALAVGDAKFQAKCFARLKQLKDDGTAILFVSHSSEQIVNHCDHAVLIDGGALVYEGQPKNVVNRYMNLLFGGASKATSADDTAPAAASAAGEIRALLVQAGAAVERFQERANYNPNEYRWGDGGVRILDFALAAGNASYPLTVESGALLQLGLRIRFERDIFRPILGITVKTKEGVTVYGSNSEILDKDGFRETWLAGSVMDVTARLRCRLASGDYFLSVGVASRDGMDVIPHDRRYDSIHFHVTNADYFGLVSLDLEMDEPVRTENAPLTASATPAAGDGGNGPVTTG